VGYEHAYIRLHIDRHADTLIATTWRPGLAEAIKTMMMMMVVVMLMVGGHT